MVGSFSTTELSRRLFKTAIQTSETSVRYILRAMEELSLKESLIIVSTFLMLPFFALLSLAVIFGRDIALVVAHFGLISVSIITVMKVVMVLLNFPAWSATQ